MSNFRKTTRTNTRPTQQSVTVDDSWKTRTYSHEREDLVRRLDRQLRRLRSADPAERDVSNAPLTREYTTNMAYLLDEIQRGPVFNAPQVIRSANDLVSALESYITKTYPDKA